jgi:hypothetical protein
MRLTNQLFQIYTSTVGLGAILSQIQNGKETVIAYASRTLNALPLYGLLDT